MKRTLCRAGIRRNANTYCMSYPEGGTVRGRTGAYSYRKRPSSQVPRGFGKRLAWDEKAVEKRAGSFTSLRSNCSHSRWRIRTDSGPQLWLHLRATEGMFHLVPAELVWVGGSRSGPGCFKSLQVFFSVLSRCRPTKLRFFSLNMFIFASSASEDLSF